MRPNVIRASEKSIADLFCDKFLFSIPSYQRPYAWSAEQAGELYDDLQYARKQQPAGQSPYFLGTIVVIKEDGNPAADVVDGQQRLATLTILLAVLRDLAPDEDARQIDRYIRQPGNKFEGIADAFRVAIREQDAAVFAKYVQAMGATREPADPRSFVSDSQARIIEVVNFYRALLGGRSEEDREALLKYIVTQCFIVVVQATDRDAAYRIFAVMNDRGLDLSPTDVLKAEILGDLPPDKRADYTDAWELLEESLGRDRFRDLFGHIVMLHLKQKRRSSLDQAFRESAVSRMAPDAFFENVLQPLGERYLNMLESSYRAASHADDINKCLKRLHRLDFSDWHPAALIAMVKLDRNPAELLTTLRRIERLAYVHFILRTHINTRIRRFAAVIDELSLTAPVLTPRSALSLTEEELADVVAVLDGPIYPITRIRKLVLLRLDEALADANAAYDHSMVSVEHVLPQSPRPDSTWIKQFPEPALRETWLHRLANLVLLSRKKNSSAANLDFDEKKAKYFKLANGGVAAFALTTQVVDTPEWTPQVLEQRQRQLLDVLRADLMLDAV